MDHRHVRPGAVQLERGLDGKADLAAVLRLARVNRGLDRIDVLALLAEPIEFCLAERVGPRARRTEVGVQALAAPGVLDQQDRQLVEQFTCGNRN